MAWSDAARAAAAEARRRHAKGKVVATLTVSAPKGGWPPSLTSPQVSKTLAKGATLRGHHAYHGDGVFAKSKSTGRTKFFPSRRGGAVVSAQQYAKK